MTDPKRGVGRHARDVVITVEHGIHTIRFCGPTMPHLDALIERGQFCPRDRGAGKPHNRRRKPKHKP